MDIKQYLRDQTEMGRYQRQNENFERQHTINNWLLAVTGGSCLVSVILAVGTLVPLFADREPVVVECRVIEYTPPRGQTGKAPTPQEL